MRSLGQVQSFAENNPGRGEIGRGSYVDRPAVLGSVCDELIDALVEMKDKERANRVSAQSGA